MSNKSITTLDDAGKANSGSAANKVAADVAETAEVAKPQAHAQSGDFSGKKARITIANSNGDGGKDAVFVSVQGVAFQIPRNKSWIVPVEVANVLRDAVETSYSRNERTGEVIVSESPRYSFIAIDIDEPAEAAA